jgi:imidazolonepropionase-like amidohydrolase
MVLTSVFAKAQDNLLIKNVKLFDGELVIEKTNVLVQEGKITQIAATIKAHDSVVTIDGSNKFLIPALSNAHVHAWSPQALNEAAKAGVINVMDMHGLEPFQKSMRQLKDSTNYANYYVAGYAATAPDGHGTQFGFPVPTISNELEAIDFVKNRVAAQVDYIKVIVEPWKPTLSSQLTALIINNAHQYNKLVVAHVSQMTDAVTLIEQNVDGLVHIWWDKTITKDELQPILKEKNIFVIPTLLTTFKALDYFKESNSEVLSADDIKKQVRLLHQLNVPILAGTDPPNLSINYGTDIYEELKLLNECGLTTIEVLKTATSNVANAFGLQNKGYIKPGFDADMILLNEDPSENIDNISAISMIWKNGKLLKL